MQQLQMLYRELGLVTKILRNLCLYYKMHKNKSPSYLDGLIQDRVKFYSTLSSQINNVSNIKTRSIFFRNSFFLRSIIE